MGDLMPEIVTEFADDQEEILSDVEVDLPEPKVRVDQSIFLEANKDLGIDEQGNIHTKPKEPKVRKKKPPSEKQLAAMEKARLKREEQKKVKDELEKLREERKQEILEREKLNHELELLRNKPPVIKEIKPVDNSELINKAVNEALTKHEEQRRIRKTLKKEKQDTDQIFDLVHRSKYRRQPRKYGGTFGFYN